MNPFLICIFYFLFSIQSFAQAKKGFDVNDISILFPIYSGKSYPSINIQNFPQLISQQIMLDILTFENPDKKIENLPYANSEVLAKRERWQVTSFRYDKCGDVFEVKDSSLSDIYFLSKASNRCQSRLRVVIQPFNSFGQSLATAIHLIYKLSAEADHEVIETLFKIKNESEGYHAFTDSIPLGIHPGLVAEQLQKSPNSKGIIESTIEELFSRTIKSDFLELATLIITVEARHWKMVGGLVKGNHWKRFVTDFNNLQYSTGSQDLGIEELSCNFYDMCKSLPQTDSSNLVLLTKIFRPDSVKPPEIEKQNSETTKLAEFVDSPKTGFFSTNCISCHESSNYRSRTVLYDPDLWQKIKGLTPFTWRGLVSESPASVINFGYDGIQAKISTRTASETVVAADRINRELNFENPGFKPTDIGVFWKCMMAIGSNANCLIN